MISAASATRAGNWISRNIPNLEVERMPRELSEGEL
jgi:hypothetical protein